MECFFLKAATLWHFEKLTSVECPKSEDIDEKCAKIIKYGTSKNFEIRSDNSEKPLKAMEVLSLHFKEKLSAFLFKFKVCDYFT